MEASDPLASTTSLLSTNTTSSSFDPKKQDKIKRAPPQKDYAAAFSALQSKYGLAEASTTPTPAPPPSKKRATSQHLPTPTNPTSSTPPTSAKVASLPAKQQGEEKVKARSSPLALLRAGYRSGGSPVPPSPLPLPAPSEGEGLRGKGDKKNKRVGATTAPQPAGEARLYRST